MNVPCCTAAAALVLAAACGGDQPDSAPAAAGVEPTVPSSALTGLFFGVVTVRPDTTCLRTIAGSPVSGTVLVVLPDEQRVLHAGVMGELSACAGEPPGPGERLHRLEAPGLEPGTMAIGVLADSVTVLDGARTDVDRDGVPEWYRACASAEGVHLMVRAGEPPGGRLLWHYYYHLDYDVEPTCTAADFDGDRNGGQ